MTLHDIFQDALLIIGVAGVAYLFDRRRIDAHALNDIRGTVLDTRDMLAAEISVAAALEEEPAAQLDPDELIAPPLSIGGESVRDRLRHVSFPERTATVVVSDFYNELLDNPRIADYFYKVESIAEQKVHFTRALLILIEKGLRRRDVDKLREVHANVRNVDGDPITPEIFDEVIGTFVEVLQRHQVDPITIQGLGRLVTPLKDAIASPVVVDK